MANDGVEAIEKFKTGKYDLILMDENMPNLGGMDATKEILKIERENALPHTPVISLTANALQGDRERFLEAGFDDYLAKPIDQELLLKTMYRLLKKDEGSH
jgi:CheY-like chemotaxis protein